MDRRQGSHQLAGRWSRSAVAWQTLPLIPDGEAVLPEMGMEGRRATHSILPECVPRARRQGRDPAGGSPASEAHTLHV